MAYQLTEIVKLFFTRTSVERILKSQSHDTIYYDELDSEYMQDLILTYDEKYSDTEINLRLSEVRRKSRGRLHVFDLLTECAQNMLVFQDNRIVCKYNRLLEWNSLMKTVGEELPVLAVIAYQDYINESEYGKFAWPPIIDHNNKQLMKILEKGIADNHFHLAVSSPYSYLSWLNLMNHPWRLAVSGYFSKMERNYRDKKKKSEQGIVRQPLRMLVMQAALIRLYLLAKLRRVGIDEKRMRLIHSLIYNTAALELNMPQMQDLLDTMPKDEKNLDYMLLHIPGRYFSGEEEYLVLSGERWFIYSMLKKVFSSDNLFTREEYNMFYGYLRIKNEFRFELVQINSLIGFENFQIYQSRKNYFRMINENSKYNELLTRMAIRDVFVNSAVKSLEVRITPKNTAAQNAKYIRSCDEAVIKAYNEAEYFDGQIKNILFPDETLEINNFDASDLRNRFRYVFHFPKRKDEALKEVVECRHYKYRKQLENAAEQIIVFRQDYPEYGRRVVGIDACSQEIGCRPEVFAKVFRTMKKHATPYQNLPYNYSVPQLKITYHAGEDFLDIADGLRAIDEAIRFLKLDCGDRLGHALALGINVKKWYQTKNSEVTLPLQDYLDNIAWFHHALIRYNIHENNTLQSWLESEFSKYFAQIYEPYVKEVQMFNSVGRSNGLHGKFDIHTYYLSWLLRGDDPELYKTGKLNKKARYGPWADEELNISKLYDDDIRLIPEVAMLYCLYHYDRKIREKGSEARTFHLPDRYMQGIACVQKAMQEEVVQRGIGIEMNPSSNISISTISDYEEHPIKVLYNIGLTCCEKELESCPQMNVSINTDDKEVFVTKLENEYALLALALEQEKKDDGTPKYKREFIYQWLDGIREMGLRQAF